MGNLKTKFVNSVSLMRGKINNDMVKISWGGGYHNLKEDKKHLKTNAYVENT